MRTDGYPLVCGYQREAARSDKRPVEQRREMTIRSYKELLLDSREGFSFGTTATTKLLLCLYPRADPRTGAFYAHLFPEHQ